MAVVNWSLRTYRLLPSLGEVPDHEAYAGPSAMPSTKVLKTPAV